MHWTKNKYTSICSLFTIIVTYMSFKQNRNHLKLLWIDLVLLTFIDPSLPLNFVILAILKHFRTYYQETQFVLQVIFNINQFAFFVILIIWFFVDIPYTSRYFLLPFGLRIEIGSFIVTKSSLIIILIRLLLSQFSSEKKCASHSCKKVFNNISFIVNILHH